MEPIGTHGFWRFFQVWFPTAVFCGGLWQEGFDGRECDSGHFAAGKDFGRLALLTLR